jgi:glycosyltransferase involved in cell wall biosynthesis
VRRVLISTIAAADGGVPTMRRFLTQALRVRGFEPVLAYYEPYSISPQMSVPTLRLLQRRPTGEQRRAPDGCESHAIGAWLPEFEFTNFFATSAWRRLMDGCDAYLTVAGNALAATPYYQTGRPFLAWLAAGWMDDRKDRVKHLPQARQIFDRAVVAPIAARLETAILRSGSILSLSCYSKFELDRIAGMPAVRAVMPMAVDPNLFSPKPGARVRGRIGYSGRLDDPRKNLDLLLEALAHMRKAGHDVSALLIGGNADQKLRRKVEQLGISDAVEFSPYVAPEPLADLLRTLDVFVVPSHQEGLCIAALEAMACGCPVVSTRCGGPEEFVVDGETGFLVASDPVEMADAVTRITGNEVLRKRLAEGARDLVVRNYSIAKAENVFWTAFENRFSNCLRAA